jgi:hypothetical protein
MSKSYNSTPRNVRALDARLRNLTADQQLQQRARRQIANTAVLAALAHHAVDADGVPLFSVKGGVAVELLLGLSARATRDLDAAVRLAGDAMGPALRDALARGWEGFAFRLLSFDPIHDTGAHRGQIKVQYRGDDFATVIFEAAPAEGAAGQNVDWVASTFIDPARLGLAPVSELPVVTLAYMIAQKLHACTDHSVPGRANDRARNLVDILLVSRLLTTDDLGPVRSAAVEIFQLRGKHTWPPAIEVVTGWTDLYALQIEPLHDFEPRDVTIAAAQAKTWCSGSTTRPDERGHDAARRAGAEQAGGRRPDQTRPTAAARSDRGTRSERARRARSGG